MGYYSGIYHQPPELLVSKIPASRDRGAYVFGIIRSRMTEQWELVNRDTDPGWILDNQGSGVTYWVTRIHRDHRAVGGKFSRDHGCQVTITMWLSSICL